MPSYLSSISYHSNGMVNTVTHGNGTKVVHGKDANDMARPASITLQRVADSAVLWQTGAYAYDGAGNIKTIGLRLVHLRRCEPPHRRDHERRRRCASARATTPSAPSRASGTGTTSCTPSAIGVDAATNRLASPVTYDAAGNMTQRGVNIYAWTRENRMLTTTGTGINRSYVYTSDGERILDRDNLHSTRTLWIRDLSGKVLREYARTDAGVWSWSKDYVLRDGQQASTVTPAATRHLHLDHLGTVRRMTDTQATPQLVATATRDFYPFGMDTSAVSDPERMRFTGHQRDTFNTRFTLDDLDYMHARYYSPTAGRFLSIDPVRGNPRTPQSWNLYAYVRNRPLVARDPDGRLFVLSADAKTRGAQLDLIKKSLHNDKAAGYLVPIQNKKGQWMVGIQGISGSDFNKLGTTAHGLNHLVGSANSYRLELGASSKAAQGGGASAEMNTIYLNSAAFPREVGGAQATAATVLAHEMGHLLENEFGEDLIQAIKNAAGRSALVQLREGFAMAYENAARAEAGMESRPFYVVPGDYADPGVSPLFP